MAINGATPECDPYRSTPRLRHGLLLHFSHTVVVVVVEVVGRVGHDQNQQTTNGGIYYHHHPAPLFYTW